MSRGTAMSIKIKGRFRRAGRIPAISFLCRTVVGQPVELTRMSASASAFIRSSNGSARPPNSAASNCARSGERLATSTERAPRLVKCRTHASPILPAPKIITVLSDKSPAKTFSASSTATLPTEVAPRPLAVWVRISLPICSAGWNSRFNTRPVNPACCAT